LKRVPRTVGGQGPGPMPLAIMYLKRKALKKGRVDDGKAVRSPGRWEEKKTELGGRKGNLNK